ncbi:hypothetical protein FRB96_008402 [Tulasnella sp. 330]|nr:hypothetical protein FRB96_008402 [Tulasnella sp. 330]
MHSCSVLLYLGLLAGGPLATWTSFLINGVSVCITAAILAEICSALPISGSLYTWAGAAAGPKYGRFVGFIVAWWVAAAWVSIVAVVCEGLINWVFSLFNVFNVDFPGGISNDNIKWRAVLWIASEAFLMLSMAVTYLPARIYGITFRLAAALITFDFLLFIIWLPIGASKTYGLRTGRDALLTTFNGTGAPPGWNWMLSFLFTSSVLTGFDAAGHIAEETKNASAIAARSIFRSAVVTAAGGFITTIVLLFCMPDIVTLLGLDAPQPFVLVYSMALGRGGGTFMTIVGTITGLFSCSVTILAASRLVFAIARDGALPLSGWLSQVSPSGLPRNAATAVYILSALLLCTILPSTTAFTSILSAGTAQLMAAYGLIALLRLTMTPNSFQNTKFPLGRSRKLLYAVSAVMNAILFAVLVSPFTFPVTTATLNFGGVVFAGITIIGVACYLILPDDKWLSNQKMQLMYDGANQPIPEKQ